MARQASTGFRTAALTALPVAPVDGQEIRFLADAANDVVWNLRYRAASAKWAFCGGGDLYALNSGDNFMPATWGDAGTPGPTIILPAGIGGDFIICFGALLYSNTAGRSAQMGIGVNSSTAVTGDTCDHITFGAAYTDYGDHSRENKAAALPAGATLKGIYQSGSGGGGGCVRRFMRVRPVRLG